MSKEKLDLSLLDNGIDFIVKGTEELFGGHGARIPVEKALELDTRNYKYGTTNLFSGFLLLLKERLSRHFPELIFSGKLSDIKQKLQSGRITPNTVDLDEALERLEVGPRFVFNDDEIKVIRRIQNFRNQFEHYKVEADKFHLLAEVTKFLDIIEQFLRNELSVELTTYSDQSRNLSSRVTKIRNYVSTPKFDSELEKRVFDVLSRLQGTTIPGRLLHSQDDIQSPKITSSQEDYILPNGKHYRPDFIGRSGDDIWSIEVKGYMRDDTLVALSTLYEFYATYRSEVSKLWLITFGSLSADVLKFSLENNIYITDGELWEEIEQI